MAGAVGECTKMADDEELLVVRRTFSSVKEPKEEEQGDTIFHARCTIQGKVFMVIIDRVSCANVMSRTLKQKLKTKLEPHT